MMEAAGRVRMDSEGTRSSGPATPRKGGAAGHDAVSSFRATLAESRESAVAFAAIKALTGVIEHSTASTMMGLQIELEAAASALKQCNPSSISLSAGSALFMRYVTRTGLDSTDFAAAKARLIERGRNFAETSLKARAAIGALGAVFVRDGSVVLCHGVSRVALEVLRHAAVVRGTHFSVIASEGSPDGTGVAIARALAEIAPGVPVSLVPDSGVAVAMERASMVLVGAEGVVESGGVINKVGTYQVATLAAAAGVPVYIAAESYKFARLFPLNQRDLPAESPRPDAAAAAVTRAGGGAVPPGLRVESPSRDYTPPSLITLLFTDLGVLTPSAVSDELIQLYR